jgi:hypothetical protein
MVYGRLRPSTVVSVCQWPSPALRSQSVIYLRHDPCSPQGAFHNTAIGCNTQLRHICNRPYYTRRQFNDGLVAALQNSRPTRLLNEADTGLEKRIRAVTDETKPFSHGDLHPLNILVECTGIMTAIIDWESDGFSVCGREYYEARKRSRNDEWNATLDEIFLKEVRAQALIPLQLPVRTECITIFSALTDRPTLTGPSPQ